MFRSFLSASISTPLQDKEQSQQRPHIFIAENSAENSAEPLARDNEEEPRDDGYVREEMSIKTRISAMW